MSRIAILGGGSWGTALAIVLSRTSQAHEISLWVRDPALAAAIRAERINQTYLPGFVLPPRVNVTHDAAEGLDRASIVIIAIPAAHLRNVFTGLLKNLPENASIVSATKGLEPSSHLRISELLASLLPREFPLPLAVLSGPSFAAEAAAGHPTAVVLASDDLVLAMQLQEEFSSSSFRLYTNQDVLSVELAGAAKNVIAIAAGVSQGLGLGANSLAALITRGLAEMTRLAVAFGGRAETLSGLAGLGDLVLTCTGALSRNRHVGIELGKGRPLADVLRSMKMVAEGVGTAPALLALAQQSNIELPITEQVTDILRSGKPPRDAIRAVMERPLKSES